MLKFLIIIMSPPDVFRTLLKYILPAAGILFCLSCSMGVKQFQRETLSDPIMHPDEDPDATQMEQHMLPYREGSAGAHGAAGGGCGC